jgi:hypothetical protein
MAHGLLPSSLGIPLQRSSSTMRPVDLTTHTTACSWYLNQQRCRDDAIGLSRGQCRRSDVPDAARADAALPLTQWIHAAAVAAAPPAVVVARLAHARLCRWRQRDGATHRLGGGAGQECSVRVCYTGARHHYRTSGLRAGTEAVRDDGTGA